MERIATLTMNPAVDVSTAVEHVVAERKLRCTRPRREAGGGGINVSRAILRLGGESIALYPAAGKTGELLTALLGDEGVEQRPVPIEGWTRESLNVTEESSERQFRFIMPGPELAEEEWRRCLAELDALDPAPGYIVASGSLPPGVPGDFYARVARRGRELGARVVVDTSGAPLRHAAAEGAFLLKPNVRELGQIFERPVHEIGIASASRELVEDGRIEAVVVSLGAAGALLATREVCRRFPSPTVPILSKVGAGDSMVAGMVLALARGEDVEEAARFGVAAGAAAAMTPGTELCRREDVERLFHAGPEAIEA